MQYQTSKNNVRAWVSDTREILSLDSDTAFTVSDVGSRYQGKFVSHKEGSLAVGTLPDGTKCEVCRCYLR